MNLIKGYKVGDFVGVIANYKTNQYDLLIKVTKDMLYKSENESYLDMFSSKLISEVRHLTGLKKEVIHITIVINQKV